ncbi:formate dehydrogenase accessory sulfurtransferase FdhD [Psychrobacter urativorans]|uniref:formate dehydrogenase accessory sulfurtransferase FdhD n=1 Tax=Psychrobacter urativorans TaxID=45610 RepID=UPI001919C9BB|nr:formate dehydrogenase accessory sulfurtransferase FdhD [Psychrobacter urativorans]
MIAEHDSLQRRHQYGDQASTDNVPETIELAETPLARSHATQKHAYPSDKHGQNSIGSLDEVHIDHKSASLAVEAAISIVINGIHYAVLMASPNQLDYLAIGFLFSEGLIQHSHELLDWEVTQLTDKSSFKNFTEESIDEANVSMAFDQLLDYDVYVVELVLNQRCHQRIQAQKRQLAGRTGCGMCGITGLTQALPDLSAYQRDTEQLRVTKPSLDSLLKMRVEVDAAQHTHQLTGAVHAAATMHEQHLHLFEDVGRHNALDKLIGWKLRHKVDVECVTMTSRLSIELVQKSIRIRLPWLVGMSAPTSTAVRVAQHYGLGLAGFLRDNRVTYYSGI